MPLSAILIVLIATLAIVLGIGLSTSAPLRHQARKPAA
jgi:hypothetical protein